jgi:putative viral A-type inclusion protein
MSTYNDYIEYLKHVDNTAREEIDKQIDSLNKEIGSLKASLTSLQKDKDVLSSQFAKSQKDLADKGDMLNMKAVEINQHLRKQTELNNSINFLKKQTEELNVSLSQEKERVKTKVAEIEEKDQQLAKQKKELDDKFIKLQAEYNELLAKQVSSDTLAAMLKRNLETLQRQLSQKTENAQQLQVQIDNLNKQNEILNQKIKQNSKNSSEFQKELQKELNEANDKIRKLNEEKEELNKKIGNLNNQNEVLKQKIKHIENTPDETALAKELEETKSKLLLLQNKNESLQSTLKTLKTQASNFESTIASLQLAIKKNKRSKFVTGLLCGAAILSLVWLISPTPEADVKSSFPTDENGASYNYSVNIEPDDSTHTGTYYYTGQTKESEPHGIGIATIPNYAKGKFDGAFKEGNLYYGVRTLGNGNVYTGPYVNNQANGVGTYQFSDGSRYIGEFKDDAMNGYGIYIDENGHKSMGKFRNNEFIE